MSIRILLEKLGIGTKDTPVDNVEFQTLSANAHMFIPKKMSNIIDRWDVVVTDTLDVYQCIVQNDFHAALVKVNEKDSDQMLDFSQSLVLFNSVEIANFKGIKAIITQEGLFKDIKFFKFYLDARLQPENMPSYKYLNDITFENFIANCDDKDLSDTKLNFLKRQYLKSVGVEVEILDKLEKIDLALKPVPKYN